MKLRTVFLPFQNESPQKNSKKSRTLRALPENR